ncbi:hypothetical protein KFL_007300030 [Klebsormidium nitens]|uniref:Uncharacterized protein n=1 Tax=Klebsormidium nitens TaxID=105231 RepID=A0A1Y1IR60_KLENI|nr:hypothetical protein KFL_007300030 [Klebsormidium nitens]|eukprot:GAQ91117.1 hypothetical protein KFL_007300030 [Klebsormidium nitens]
MNSQEWAVVAGGHRVPAAALNIPSFDALRLAYQGKDQSALDSGQEFSSWLPKQVFLCVGKRYYSEQFLTTFGRGLKSAIYAADACTNKAKFTDYLFLESLLKFGQLYDVIGEVQDISELLKDRLARTLAEQRAELAEQRANKAEELAKLLATENLKLKRKAADISGEGLPKVQCFVDKRDAPSEAIGLTAEDHDLIRTLQQVNYEAVVNWKVLAESSGFSIRQLRGLAVSFVDQATEAIVFQESEPGNAKKSHTGKFEVQAESGEKYTDVPVEELSIGAGSRREGDPLIQLLRANGMQDEPFLQQGRTRAGRGQEDLELENEIRSKGREDRGRSQSRPGTRAFGEREPQRFRTPADDFGGDWDKEPEEGLVRERSPIFFDGGRRRHPEWPGNRPVGVFTPQQMPRNFVPGFPPMPPPLHNQTGFMPRFQPQGMGQPGGVGQEGIPQATPFAPPGFMGPPPVNMQNVTFGQIRSGSNQQR